MIPFDKAVIIGSEAVSFSALYTAKHAGIKVISLIEENNDLNTYNFLKTASETLLRVPVKKGCRIISINGENKEITGITIEKNGKMEEIECNGIIFTGKFTPESAILQKTFNDFNHNNSSLFVSQAYQTSNEYFFAAGNILRGALAAFKCFFEGRNVAHYVDMSLKNKLKPKNIQIEVDDNVEWYYPSMIDLNIPMKFLTKLRLKKHFKGRIKVYVNDKQIINKFVNVKNYNNIILPAVKNPLTDQDKISIKFEKD
jgi:hypothetical protein